MRTISLKLNETLDEKLIEIAQKQGISKSRVIRNAVIAYLKVNNDFSSESCFSLAHDLLGSIDGPFLTCLSIRNTWKILVNETEHIIGYRTTCCEY